MDGSLQITTSTSITTTTGTATSIPSNIKIYDTAGQHVDASPPGTTDLFEQQQQQQQQQQIPIQPQSIQNLNPASSSSSMISSHDPLVNRDFNGCDNGNQSVTNNTSASTTNMNDSSSPSNNKNENEDKDTRSSSTEAKAGPGNDNDNDNNSVDGTVGSFSVDTEDVEPAFGDTSAPSGTFPNADVDVDAGVDIDVDVDARVDADADADADADGNESSQKESSETPIIDDRSGGIYPVVDPPNDLFENSRREQIQIDQEQPKKIPEEGTQPCLNPPPVVTNTSTRRENNNNATIEQPPQGNVTANTAGDSKSNININHSDDNQLMRCEGDLRAAEKIGYDQRLHGASRIVQTPNNVTPRDVTNDQGRGQQRQNQQQNQQQGRNEEIIVLLDDDDVVEMEVEKIQSKTTQRADKVVKSAGFKRPRSPIRNENEREIVPGSNTYRYQSQNDYEKNPNKNNQNNHSKPGDQVSDPQYIIVSPNHKPTWEFMFPSQNIPAQPTYNKNQHKHFELSLLNVSEFTITGLPVSMDGRLSSVLGFRKVIKQVSRGHGKAVFERDNPKQKANQKNDFAVNHEYSSYGELHNPDGGKWRIPLGAYRAFYSYLKSDSLCRVEAIPEDQLKIASLGKARLDKGYPSVKKIVSYGVPKGLAKALAPFQRGGVGFVAEKFGRALIADDMGLGKTVQSIASMSMYHDEWPLLIFTPSTARYHWAVEFNNWLGSKSAINNGEESDDCIEEDHTVTKPPKKPMRLLEESEINVMVSGRDKLFPTRHTRIVICSYGLATSLVESRKIRTGLFKCAIVDESHMLKNIKAKRTSKLIPILHSTNRCILLSGTPALARPTELWPQLKILSTERDGWWDDEGEFVRKYVQRTSAIRRAELHTMLTGTVMIRRLKHDILKSLRNKQREKAIIDVVTPDVRREFHKCMEFLREGRGVMAKIAKNHKEQSTENVKNPRDEENKKLALLEVEYDEMYKQKMHHVRTTMQTLPINEVERRSLMMKYDQEARIEVDVWYRERVNEIQNESSKNLEEKVDRKAILNKMYSMTYKAKIPLIAELLGKWLDDPTKGKLCIFAHHIYVLDELSKRVGLSNAEGSRKRFIRIDGSTSPKERQSQIVAFQNDPDIRVAILGITAAGVAVTLTASSTVWFAELFWTPALMIQAEDRCHRIGQNAAVKCLYFVATGTLDVLLWDLLEKKFQDLGEFVEGKEKMNIVVQKTYKSNKELRSMFDRSKEDDLDDDMKLGENESPTEGDDLINFECDLQKDIGQLAQEEMIMMSLGEDEDVAENRMIGKAIPQDSSTEAKSDLGQTEDEAICLSDDEDEKQVSNTAWSQQSLTDDRKEKPSPAVNDFKFARERVLHKFRFYKQYFDGSSFGIQLLFFDHRLAIAKNTFGKIKPALGDVLVAVNGYRLPLGCPLNDACRYMKDLLKRGTVELTFVEDDAFVEHYSARIKATRQEISKKLQAASTKSEVVIDLLDDD